MSLRRLVCTTAFAALAVVGCGGGAGDDDDTSGNTPKGQETDADGFCPTASEVSQGLGLNVKFHSRINDICGYGPSTDVENVDISYDFDVSASEFTDEWADNTGVSHLDGVGDDAYILTNQSGSASTMVMARQGTTTITLAAAVVRDPAIAFLKVLLAKL